MSEQRTLHHFPLDPSSRLVRLALGEKRIGFSDQVVRYWESSADLTRLNPSGMIPVLELSTREGVLRLCEARAILGWADEEAPDTDLWPGDRADRAEARRLTQWFERKFDWEVNALLLHEKMEKRLLGLGPPDTAAVRAGREALRAHLDYLDRLVADRAWIAGDRLSLADFAAAAQISIHDYFAEVPWRDFPAARTWYSKLKSRPCFRPLLADRQPGMAPSSHYDDLDF